MANLTHCLTDYSHSSVFTILIIHSCKQWQYKRSHYQKYSSPATIYERMKSLRGDCISEFKPSLSYRLTEKTRVRLYLQWSFLRVERGLSFHTCSGIWAFVNPKLELRSSPSQMRGRFGKALSSFFLSHPAPNLKEHWYSCSSEVKLCFWPLGGVPKDPNPSTAPAVPSLAGTTRAAITHRDLSALGTDSWQGEFLSPKSIFAGDDKLEFGFFFLSECLPCTLWSV